MSDEHAWIMRCINSTSVLHAGAPHHVVILTSKAPTITVRIESEHELPYMLGEEYVLTIDREEIQ